MMKKTALIGLMLVLGVMPMTMVNASGPVEIADVNGCGEPDDIHYYFFSSGFTLWESKKDDLVLFGAGIANLADTCTDPVDGTDNDFEWGLGGANLPVNTVPACRTVIGHHTLDFYTVDLVAVLGGEDFSEAVAGSAGADGAHPGNPGDPADPPAPCGDGLIAPDLQPEDCLEPFWGHGPHTACGVGADGSYWVFVDTVTVDLNEPRVGAGTQGCIWTSNFAGKQISRCGCTLPPGRGLLGFATIYFC